MNRITSRISSLEKKISQESSKDGQKMAWTPKTASMAVDMYIRLGGLKPEDRERKYQELINTPEPEPDPEHWARVQKKLDEIANSIKKVKA